MQHVRSNLIYANRRACQSSDDFRHPSTAGVSKQKAARAITSSLKRFPRRDAAVARCATVSRGYTAGAAAAVAIPSNFRQDRCSTFPRSVLNVPSNAGWRDTKASALSTVSTRGARGTNAARGTLSGEQNDPVAHGLRASARSLMGVAVFSGVINLLTLSGSLYMLQVYDRVIPSRNIATLVGLSMIVLLAYLVQGYFDALRVAHAGAHRNAVRRRPAGADPSRARHASAARREAGAGPAAVA